MKPRFIITFVCILFSSITFSQEYVLQEKTTDFSDIGKEGPNLFKYTFWYFNSTYSFGDNKKGAELSPLALHNSNFGTRLKLKLNKYLAFGLGLNFHSSTFPIKQNSDKIVPDTMIYKKQIIELRSPGAEAFIRINFNKRRGNMIGTFLDFGVLGEHNTFSTISNTYYKDAQKHIEKIRKISFIEPFTGFAVVRFGHNFFSVTASYRLTALFKPSYNFPELPVYSVGLELSTHK